MTQSDLSLLEIEEQFLYVIPIVRPYLRVQSYLRFSLWLFSGIVLRSVTTLPILGRILGNILLRMTGALRLSS
jgi:hypothetical protein